MKSSEPISSTIWSLCDIVSVVVQWKFGRTMFWLSIESSMPFVRRRADIGPARGVTRLGGYGQRHEQIGCLGFVGFGRDVQGASFEHRPVDGHAVGGRLLPMSGRANPDGCRRRQAANRRTDSRLWWTRARPANGRAGPRRCRSDPSPRIDRSSIQSQSFRKFSLARFHF